MKTRTSLRACLAASIGVGASLCACEKPPPPPPPPKKVEAPPPPEPVRADAILQTMRADARVQFPQSAAPTDEPVARAVIGLADALARGDSEKFREMLDPNGQAVLDKLVAGGHWDDSTGKVIEAVRVSRISGSGSGGTLMLAVQEARGAYPLQWAYAKAGGAVIFTGVQSPDVVRARASEFDGGNLPAASEFPVGAARPTAGSQSPATVAAQPSGAAPAESPPASTGDRRRGTPNGPVTVPGTARPDGG